MKMTTGGNRAHELEHIQCVDLKGPTVYSNRRLYIIEGKPGLWRRVPANYDGDMPTEDAYLFGAIVFLTRAELVEDELQEAEHITVGSMAAATKDVPDTDY